jgi:VIT1/CCC1 family predicted Fe2+/Mn2+ transporter
VAYTSFGSDRDFYLAERAREQKEIAAQRKDERGEIREIYAAKGFKGHLLEDVVSTITANRETWVSTMMNEELHLQPVAQRSLVQSAVIVTVATLIGHFIPIAPFMVVARTPAIILAIALSARRTNLQLDRQTVFLSGRQRLRRRDEACCEHPAGSWHAGDC